jgi:hypothetical protein
MAQSSQIRGCFANVLKSVEKPDSGISSSSICLFGTGGSSLQKGNEITAERVKERRSTQKPVSDYSRYNLLKNPPEIMD